MDTIYLDDIPLKTIIGTYDWERALPQRLLLSLSFAIDCTAIAQTDALEKTVDYEALSQRLVAYAAEARCHLVETLAYQLAAICEQEFALNSFILRLSKPGALPEARDVGVEIVRGTMRPQLL